MKPCVLDTSVASLMYDASPLYAPYARHVDSAIVFIGFQTVAEMRYGALKNNWGEAKRQKLESFLTGMQITGYTEELSYCWARVMYEAQRAGRRLEPGDAWIAATALLLNAALITHDKDFSPESCPSLTIIRYAS